MNVRSCLGVLSLALALAGCRGKQPKPSLSHLSVPAVPTNLAPKPKHLELEPLTDELRVKGFGECNPHDPLELGPYALYRSLSMGRILIPQKGGHTEDMGYDVLVHFHGSVAVRKLLVQVARGTTLVMIDKGNGGGPYVRALRNPEKFMELRHSIEAELRHQSKDERAHIRHMAVSAWSAGAVAVDALLKQKQPGIDAYIVLDGLPAGYKPGAPHVPELQNLDVAFVEPELEVAKLARTGAPTFVLTHSEVVPVDGPSTTLSARLLLRGLGLTERPVDPGQEPYGQISSVDERALHVWGFRGKDERAHCAQLTQIARIVTEVLEPAWDTPPMDRSVPRTPLPAWERRRR